MERKRAQRRAGCAEAEKEAWWKAAEAEAAAEERMLPGRLPVGDPVRPEGLLYQPFDTRFKKRWTTCCPEGGVASLVGTWRMYAVSFFAPHEEDPVFFGSRILLPCRGRLALRPSGDDGGELTGLLSNVVTAEPASWIPFSDGRVARLTVQAPRRQDKYGHHQRWTMPASLEMPEEDLDSLNCAVEGCEFSAELQLCATSFQLLPLKELPEYDRDEVDMIDMDAEQRKAFLRELGRTGPSPDDEERTPLLVDKSPLHVRAGHLHLQVDWGIGDDYFAEYLLRRDVAPPAQPGAAAASGDAADNDDMVAIVEPPAQEVIVLDDSDEEADEAAPPLASALAAERQRADAAEARVKALEAEARQAAKGKRSAEAAAHEMRRVVGVKRELVETATAAAATATAAAAAATADAARAANELDKAMTCIVCLDEPRQMIFMPCAHFAVCSACHQVLHVRAEGELSIAERLKNVQPKPMCPICRKPAELVVGPIYHA